MTQSVHMVTFTSVLISLLQTAVVLTPWQSAADWHIRQWLLILISELFNNIQQVHYKTEFMKLICTSFKILLTPIGVLAPGSVHARSSAQPPIDMSRNFSPHVSAEYPSNISPNFSEIISRVSEILKFKKKLKNAVSGGQRGSQTFVGGYYILFWLV